MALQKGKKGQIHLEQTCTNLWTFVKNRPWVFLLFFSNHFRSIRYKVRIGGNGNRYTRSSKNSKISSNGKNPQDDFSRKSNHMHLLYGETSSSTSFLMIFSGKHNIFCQNWQNMPKIASFRM